MGDPSNPLAMADQLDAERWARNVFMATVVATGLGSGNSVQIRRASALRPDSTPYPILSSYATPVVGDVVLAIAVGGSVIVLGDRLL